MSATSQCPVHQSAPKQSETGLTPELREQIRAKLAADPAAMTVVVARELRVPEVEVIRSMPLDKATELDATKFEQILRDFEPMGMLHVIASNGACTLECFGQFGNFSTWGDYFNVQTKSLDMHIRHKQINAIFAVVKPSHMDSKDTISFQFYDRSGGAAFKVFLTFGGDEIPAEKRAAFEALRDKYKLA